MIFLYWSDAECKNILPYMWKWLLGLVPLALAMVPSGQTETCILIHGATVGAIDSFVTETDFSCLMLDFTLFNLSLNIMNIL